MDFLKAPYRYVPIPLASGKIGHVFAGPTDALPKGYKLVRCAREIPVDVGRVAFDVSTGDFCPFDPVILARAIPLIIRAIEAGEPLYVGCMGGTGRTGTLLAVLVAQHPGFDGKRAVDYIRQVYRTGAVETAAQVTQVERFAVHAGSLRGLWRSLWARLTN